MTVRCQLSMSPFSQLPPPTNPRPTSDLDQYIVSTAQRAHDPLRRNGVLTGTGNELSTSSDVRMRCCSIQSSVARFINLFRPSAGA